MALVSPGIQISVTDQSNYVPASNGTIPFILLATAENKAAPGGGVASGTMADNAGKLYAITSQRDLVTTFGSPTFQTSASGSAINGSELNEYGLLAAYSALGVSNQVYVQRADVNLAELSGSTSRPSGAPDTGSYWVDTTNTNFGIFSWSRSSNTFAQVTPIVDTTITTNVPPSSMVGIIGSYLVTASTVPMNTWYKDYTNTWVVAGGNEWQLAHPAVVGTVTNPTITANSNVVVNGTTVNLSIGQNAESIVNTIDTALNNSFVNGVKVRLVNNAVTFAASDEAESAGVGAGADGKLAISGTALADLGIISRTYNCAAVSYSSYYNQPAWSTFDTTPRPSGSLWIKTTRVGNGTDLVVKQYNSVVDQWSSVSVNNYGFHGEATYANDPNNGGLNIAAGVVWADYDVYGDSTVSWNLWYRKNAGETTITGATTAISSTLGGSFTLKVTQPGANGYPITEPLVFAPDTTPTNFVNVVNSLSIPYLQLTLNEDNKVVITHTKGGDVKLESPTGDILSDMGLTLSADNMYQLADSTDSLIGTNWAPLAYYVANSQPYAAPTDGTLWYWNTPTHVDIMINDGTAWRGYRNVTTDIRGYDLSDTDSNGVIIQTTAPITQSNGSALAYGDLWLDTSDLENFPVIYRRQRVNGADTWVLLDNTDSVSQNGIVFGDARWSTSGNVDPVFDSVGSIKALLTSDYLDLDAPDAALYPRGTLLFNTRATSYNVKKYVENYFTEAAYPNQILPTYKDAWVSVSAASSGSLVPSFGRQAQRSVVVAALKSAIDSSTALREEQNQFSLIAAPGYPELIPNMINLNNDRNNSAFIIGDTPLRLPANGTEIIAWANNTTNQTQTNEKGLANNDPYLALYYPCGQTNDLNGNPVVVPPSHAMIRTFIRSDNASYPWFAPAGTLRGVLDNVSSVGYIDSTSGSFVAIGVTQGLRDIMYNNRINPLTYLQGTGLVAYGNKTLATTPSAMDRINVSRLVNYIRTQLDRLGRPYIFEPNDPITRNQIKAITESLLNDIVAKRGITDYLVVCDTSNNTPDRISRNELYVDVAIQPTKSVEFIYIPIRLKNPGEIESGNVAPALTVGTGA